MAERVLTILTYHAVDDRGDVISVTPETFRHHVRTLEAHGIRGVSLADAMQRFERDEGTADKEVVITFDDAYLSVRENAFPVLEKAGFSATVFVPTAFVGETRETAARINKDLDRDMLDWEQIGELAAAGIEIGAHTRTHPDLTGLDDQALDDELLASRLELEKHVHRPALSFAYPYGHHDGRVRKAAGRHFRYACTTHLGHNPPGSDPLLLRRIDAYYLDRDETLVRAARGEMGLYWGFRQALRNIRSLVR